MKQGEAMNDANMGKASLSLDPVPEPNLKDPQVILSLLEADQTVAAKQRMHFGRRNLSFEAKALLWGLRVYVAAMLVLVVISVVRAIHSVP
jgi:hypothetical protein